MLTKYQAFTVERVWRSSINLAHYNPRKISPEAKKRLTRNIRDDVGLVETITVNGLTNNLVSGHQRLAILDKAEGFPKKDYQLDVAMVLLTEEQERRQNVFMNSPSAQGEYDPELLVEMTRGQEIEEFGLTENDLALLGASEPVEEYNDEYFDKLFTKKTASAEQQENNKKAVQDMKEQIATKAGNKIADNALSYVVLNFPDYATKSAFMRRFDLDPMQTYTDGIEFSNMVERIYD